MAANPALVTYEQSYLGPQLYTGEALVLRRDHVAVEVDNLRTPNGDWKSIGSVFLTSGRLVFISQERDPDTGLHSFEIPLASIRNDKFNQPIFGCNNLSGEVLQSAQEMMTQEIHAFALYFKNGGVGTFLPFYYRFMESLRQPHQQAARHPSIPQESIQASVTTAFVDPSDPTKIYLAQPNQQG